MQSKETVISALSKVKLEYNTEITEIEFIGSGSFAEPSGKNVYTGIPAFYRVVCHSCPGKGSFIRSEIWLPEEWNGIFVGLGNGGIAGGICYGALAEQVRGGYAAANTDMGTSRGYYLSGIDNPDVWKDFGWRSTHIMTVIGKALTVVCYGKSPCFSYFMGVSTGGQQALSEAQRFPDDYDGIIAAVPANNRIYLHTYFLWNYVHLRTRDGKRMFNCDEVSVVTRRAAEFFQMLGDGERGDGFVSFPWAGEDTVERFIAFLAVNHGDFTMEQLEALRKVYNGPINTVTGERIYNGMPIGSEIYGCGIMDCSGDKPPHYYPFMWTFGADYDPYDFDFGKDMETVDKLLSADLNADSPDLGEFIGKGGKLIIYSGSADPCVPYPDALAYFKRVTEALGGDDKASPCVRYFLMPGRDHGGGGLGANREYGENGECLLSSLRRWRESGIAPEYLTALRVERAENGDAVKKFERKIYPCLSSTVTVPAHKTDLK